MSTAQKVIIFSVPLWFLIKGNSMTKLWKFWTGGGRGRGGGGSKLCQVITANLPTKLLGHLGTKAKKPGNTQVQI
jgi:hypothetical protein